MSVNAMTSRWQKILVFSTVIFLGALITWGVIYLRKPTTFPFRRIEILTTLHYTRPAHLEQLVWSNLKGGFFSFDAEQIKRALLENPWIENISIRRKWPDILTLSVEEQHPQARWEIRGVINQEGQIFYPPLFSIPESLPVIEGVKMEKEIVLSDFQAMNGTLKWIGLHIQRLNLKSATTYEVLLSNGIVIVVDQKKAVRRFARFVSLYPQIIGKRSAEVERVDLRYTNGLAVKWRNANEELNAKSISSGNKEIRAES